MKTKKLSYRQYGEKEKKMNKTVNIEISKKGIPCLWESGGGWSNTGYVTVIAGTHGEAKKAIYVKLHGDLACKDHALITVKIGDYVINAEHNRKEENIEVYQITGINLDDKIAELSQIDEIPKFLKSAIKACVDKSYDYHCRTPYYCIY